MRIVRAGDFVDQGAFLVGESAFPGAQRPAGEPSSLRVLHRGPAGPGDGLGVCPIPGPGSDPFRECRTGHGGSSPGGAWVPVAALQAFDTYPC